MPPAPARRRAPRAVLRVSVACCAATALAAACSWAFGAFPPARRPPRSALRGLGPEGGAPPALAGAAGPVGAPAGRGGGRVQGRREATATADTPPDAEEVLSGLDPQRAVVRRMNDAAEGFVAPAVWNRPLFRAAVLALGGTAAGRVVPFAGMVHTSAYGVWLGTAVWTTFIAGATMRKNLPRQQFGKVQSKLFPKFFQLGTLCTAVMLLSGARLGLPLGPAIASLTFTLMNLLYLEPKATGVMFERYERENQGLKDPAVDEKLKSEFGKFHGMSSLASLLALVTLVTHGVYLSARL